MYHDPPTKRKSCCGLTMQCEMSEEACVSVCMYVCGLLLALVMMVVWILGRKATPPAEQRGWLDLGVSQCTRERKRPLHPHAAYMLSSCFFAARLHYTTRCVLRCELNLVEERVCGCVWGGNRRAPNGFNARVLYVCACWALLLLQCQKGCHCSAVVSRRGEV